MIGLTESLIIVVVGLVTTLIYKWIKDPLRKIPGPPGSLIVGNALMLDPKKLHLQLHELAKQFGPIMKLNMFGNPIVVINDVEWIFEALNRKGTDFQGRPPFPRLMYVLKRDMGFSTYDKLYLLLRRVSTAGLHSFGPGVAKIEKVLQDVLQEFIEDINEREGQEINMDDLISSFVCCAMVTLMWGQKYSPKDPICQEIHHMNQNILALNHPIENSPLLDMFPSLLNLPKAFFKDGYKLMDETKQMGDKLVMQRIKEEKVSFDEDQMRGMIDYFIKAQREELDEDGEEIITDQLILGMIVDFVIGGMETSHSSILQAFLDLLHDKPLMVRLQAEIDAHLEQTQIITLNDRAKLPLLEAFIHENQRLLSAVPLLVFHSTLRDTELRGYEIPKDTTIMFNGFHTAHNPDVYPEPFMCKPERFLDEDGQVVPPGHPARHNFVGFGSGIRHCPGELLARSRMFLFLAGILQKFDIEPAGVLPDRDVRNYEMGIVVKPPRVNVKFSLRRCVE